MDKKTARKNQTKLAVIWPSEDKYWTIKDLWKDNPQFKAEITLRVRLTTAIKETNTVAVIGDKMNNHGRPQMVCAVRQANGIVKQSTIDAAKAAGIRVADIATNINPAKPAAVNINPASVVAV